MASINNSTKFNLVKGIVGCSLLCAMVFLQGCNASMKNRMLGRSWTYMNGHEVVIAPCYWPTTSVETTGGTGQQQATHQFTCGKTVIEIAAKPQGDELFVDGKPHGMLHKGDAVAIENGKLLINSKEVVEIAGK